MLLAPFFGIALDLDPLSIGVFAFFAVAFILMFVISSANGDAKGMFDWMRETQGQRVDTTAQQAAQSVEPAEPVFTPP